MLFKWFKIIYNWLFWCNIDESILSIMFLNCTFICCYIKSMCDYLFGMQKAPISRNDPRIIYCWLEEVLFSKFAFAHSFGPSWSKQRNIAIYKKNREELPHAQMMHLTLWRNAACEFLFWEGHWCISAIEICWRRHSMWSLATYLLLFKQSKLFKQ